MAETKMTTAEKMSAIRAQAREVISLPEEKYQVGTDTYVVETEHGYAKVTISAVKAKDFDPEFEQEQFFFEREEKARIQAEKQAERERVKAEKLAKKKAKEEAEAESKE